MTIRVRLSGDPGEITAVIDALRNRFDLAGAERAYPNRGAFGVRVYLEVHTRQTSDPRGRTESISPSDGGHPAR